MDYKELLESKDYDFLRNDSHLGNRLLFICLTGSYSYGTNREDSDIDIRGVTLDTIASLSGIETFEQYEDDKTDTVIYSLSKFIRLASQCNPNIIELLFLEKEHYLYMTPLGQKIIDNREIFLSRKAIHTFGGYANAQLNRLENALARNEDTSTYQEKMEHINRSILNVIDNLYDKLNVQEDSFKSYVNEDLEIAFDINVKNLPYFKLKAISDELHNTMRNYSTKTMGKNARKDDKHLNKHMMHLVRLYLEANELLKDNVLKVYRKDDLKLLNDIRDGKYRNANGSLTQDFKDLLNSLTSEFDILKAQTNLPKEPDYPKIKKLLEEIFQEGLVK